MITTRVPPRISLGGGGTDLPSHYCEHGGSSIATATDEYVHIIHHRTFQQEIIVKYLKLERLASADEIEHPIVRESRRGGRERSGPLTRLHLWDGRRAPAD
jgi:D-glycero-alpha-D-manno-heptose-7-phosphate kinase